MVSGRLVLTLVSFLPVRESSLREKEGPSDPSLNAKNKQETKNPVGGRVGGSVGMEGWEGGRVSRYGGSVGMAEVGGVGGMAEVGGVGALGGMAEVGGAVCMAEVGGVGGMAEVGGVGGMAEVGGVGGMAEVGGWEGQ